MSLTPKISVPNTPKIKDPNHIPVWHKQQEQILKKWSEIGSSYRYLHDKSFQKFDRQNLWFALPVIIISTITGTANFAQGSFPDSWKSMAPLGIGFLNLSAGLITTVAQFLRVSELLEGHRAASIAYSKFARNISVELSLPIKERTEDGSVFITNCRSELDRLIEQSPDIPEDVLKKFVKRFPDPVYDSSKNLVEGYDFFRPDILDIKSINIYRDVEEEERRKRQAEKIRLLKEQEEESKRFKKLFDEQEKEKARIIAETKKQYEKEQAKRDRQIKQMVELTKKTTQAELINNKFSVSNIEETMSDLLGSLNQTAEAISDISDSDDDDDDADNDISAGEKKTDNTTIQGIQIVIEDPEPEVNNNDTTDNSNNVIDN